MPAWGGEPRLRLLETIREVGLQRLAEHGDEARVRDAHAACFIDLAIAMDREHPASRQDIAHVTNLGPDQENVRAAMEWLERPEDVAMDAEGRVYVADTNGGKIIVFDAEGNELVTWETGKTMPGGPNLPYAVAVDGAGAVYVSGVGTNPQ